MGWTGRARPKWPRLPAIPGFHAHQRGERRTPGSQCNLLCLPPPGTGIRCSQRARHTTGQGRAAGAP
eukprot:4242883-Prorocentrum_lima.AAC.1